VTSYLLVVNPVSGRGRARGRAEQLGGLLAESADVRVVETQRRGSASDLVAEHAQEVDRVIAIGGDGTLNEALTGLFRVGLPAERLPALGFLPSGTANAAVRALGLRSDPAAVARALVAGGERPIDVGVVRHGDGERPFLLWFGAGLDAVVISVLNSERTGFMGTGGLVRSAPRIWRAVGRYAAPDIYASGDGRTLQGVSTVILANVGRVAFGGAVADVADPFDGHLDMVALPSLPKWRLPAFGARMLTSSLHRAKGVHHALVSGMRLDSEGDVPFQLDGEPVGTLPVEISVKPGAVRFLLT